MACAGLLAPAPAAAALTEAKRLAAVYESILQARFGEVEAQLKQACPPAPSEACQSLRVVAAWWEIQINPESRKLDARFGELASSAIAANEAWTRREPQRAEAWFYLAASHGPLVQWRVTRGERLAAAREGKKIKDALERALQLDPGLHDAYFGIGLYHYYADVAPAAAKILRFVLLLPGGDRVRGLKEMLQARDRGELLRGEAEYQLHFVYLWYERKPDQALQILDRLNSRYGHNPLFLRHIADIRGSRLGDHPASAIAWRTLVDRARAGRVYDAARTEIRGRLGLAQALDQMFETDRAIGELKTVLAAPPEAMPDGARARAQLQLGTAYDRIGERDSAVQAYNAAIAEAATDETRQIRERASAALRQTPDLQAAEAYRLSLVGWRALERGATAEAEAALTRAAALSPSDAVVRYRYGRMLQASGDTSRAREELEKVTAAAPSAPAVILSSALVAYAHLLEGAGDLTRAQTMYQRAIELAGGDRRARDDARRALRRLQQPPK